MTPPDLWVAALAGLALLVAAAVGAWLARRSAGLAVSDRVGPYRLSRKLGEGGMGTVFEARHELLGRRTAVKVIRPRKSTSDSAARFMREARLSSELAHPNTVSVYEYGRTRGGVRYFAMELVDGLTLAQLVAREGPLPSGRVLVILRQVAASLAHAHARGLIHRDIKPSNVMLCHREGHPDCVKVLDFGLAKRFAAESDCALSGSGWHIGTPEFMAPECVDDPVSVGTAADVYAVGALAYVLLTGSPPFSFRTVDEIARAHRTELPLPPSLRRPWDLSPELEAIVLSCLAKRAGDRFRDGAALLDALERCSVPRPWSNADAERWWRLVDLGAEARSSVRHEVTRTRVERDEPTVPFALARRRAAS
ncbi:MAG: serine/threonine protein kinase [Myxococcales bacterium]|nr:serine/threonine protein kinase [Myxococcales bacterium]